MSARVAATVAVLVAALAVAGCKKKPAAPQAGAAAPAAGQQKGAPPVAGTQKAQPGQQKAPPPAAGAQKAQPGQQKAAPTPAAPVPVAGRPQVGQQKAPAPGLAQSPAGQQKAAPTAQAPGVAQAPAGGRPAAAPADSAPDSTHIDYRREVYNYQGGSRDPFVSLLTADESAVSFADLKLVSILYDAAHGRSVAVVHDRQINRDFRIRRGDTIGRLRVLQIRQYEVVFQIEEFGFERQEVLTLPRVEVNR